MKKERRAELAFEFIERCVRLYDHIDRSIQGAVLPGTRPTVQVEIAVEVKDHLFELLQQAIIFYNEGPDISDFETYFKNRIQHLASVHIHGLPRIPRAREPIEIVSFLRQSCFSNLEAAKAEKYSNIRIFATELLGNSAHNSYDIFDEKKILEVKDSSVPIGELAESLLSDTPPRKKKTALISLPRVDLNSPLGWPSLLHEIAHIDVSIDDVWQTYTRVVSAPQQELALQAVAEYAASENPEDVSAELRGWLLECWCDAFAVVCAGPAVFFAQMHSFAFSSPGYMEQHVRKGLKYPPAWFRLKLILAFSAARLDGAHEETRRFVWKAMEDEKRLIAELFGHKALYDANLDTILSIIKEFIRTEFPRASFGLAAQISSANLQQLVGDLSEGLPIPSISNTEHGGSQRAASSSEILLAGWIYRCTELRNRVEALVTNPHSSSEKNAQLLIAQIKRADEALKRSIQMSEWFNILNSAAVSQGGSNFPPDSEQNSPLEKNPGVLSDRDLNALLSNNLLRIIPLIDEKFQVRGTVIDLRLGHNFEIFPSSVPRIVDPMVYTSEQVSESLEVDVDFGKGINIGPGQFLLAHTLEYIKLPTDVAAQVEGRSSFARIGLQVHMTANLVEAGFDGCLTLEVVNNGPSSIRLYPGMRIAQLRFFRLSNPPKFPYGVSGETKYSGRLSHNKTQQFSDWEIEAITQAKTKFKIDDGNNY